MRGGRQGSRRGGKSTSSSSRWDIAQLRDEEDDEVPQTMGVVQEQELQVQEQEVQEPTV